MIDSHVHVWDRGRAGYGWLSRPPFDRLPRRIGVDDVPPLAEEQGIVLVEAGADGADDDLLREASVHPRVVAVVPALPATAQGLEGLLERDERRSVAAVRWQAQREPAGVPFRELTERVAIASAAGIGIELVVGRARAREAALALLEAGASRILVDHLAGIPRTAAELPGWRSDLDALGALEAVTVKLSGARSASPTVLGALVRETLDRLRPERLMWGSDWPVAGVDGVSREALHAATADALAAAGLSPDESATVLHRTAADWYRLRE